MTEKQKQADFQSIEEVRSYLSEILEVQYKPLEKYLISMDLIPMAIGSLLEDVANRFLDLSDIVREQHMSQEQKEAREQGELSHSLSDLHPHKLN